MAPPPPPPDEIAKLMQFIAQKSANVKSPMSVRGLALQFKEESGSMLTVPGLKSRIHTNRLKIHEMNEFDVETKVRMMFALSAPIAAEFFIELKKVAEVEVDDQKRIIQYKQNDGGLELCANYMTLSMNHGEQKASDIIRFVAEKSKTTDKSIADRDLLKEFKEKTGCKDPVETLEQRYQRVKRKIYHLTGIDKNTKVKMLFISHAKLPDDVLKEIRKDADVEVDEEGKITKYKSKDGSLELEGSHGMSSIKKSFYSDRWDTICEKINEVDSEKNDKGDANWQKDYERKGIELVRFLIERTKNATSPLNVNQLAKDYKAEFKSSEHQDTTNYRIRSFRQRIYQMNQFDNPTKVKLMFALSSAVDEKFLKKLQKDAIVELDGNQRIKKYEANDGSLILKGDHSMSAKTRTRLANRKTARVVNESSESEDDGDEENVGGSLKSNQASTSLPMRRSQKIRKSIVSTNKNNKKRTTTTQRQSAMSNQGKRARISSSSSEGSEDDEESMALEHDSLMDIETNNLDHGGDDFDYDPPVNNHYDENLEHNVTDPISERNIATPEVTDEVEEERKKEEESSASSSAKIESMSLLELLTHLRLPIAQYSPTLAPRIDENIKQLESEDQQVPIYKILESFESCIQILSTPDEMDSDDNTTSLSDFYYHLGMAICNITNSSMDDFHVKMRKLATTGDEKVSMEHIRYAMGETIDKILN